jgi:hypothetical protein
MERDAVKVLTDEHEGIQDLFARVSKKDEDRPAVLQQLLHTLALHVSVEKQMLVPVVKDRVANGGRPGPTTGRLPRRGGAHSRYPGSPQSQLSRRPDLVNRLLHLTDDHIAEWQGAVVPVLRRALTETELADLGAAMVSDERDFLTHPHPHLPDSGPLAEVARRVAGLVDHNRDKSADIGRTSS